MEKRRNKGSKRARRTSGKGSRTSSVAVIKGGATLEPSVPDPKAAVLDVLEKIGTAAVEAGPLTGAREILARRWGIGDDERRKINELVNVMFADRTGANEIELRQTLLRESLAATPNDYSECYKIVSHLLHTFRSDVAALLGPRLNEALKGKPQDTYDEKQALASWVNNELRQLGLAIRDPNSGKPAILVADVKGGVDSPSRFRFEIRGEDGTRKRTFSSRSLPELELMEDELRREPLSKQVRR